MNRTEIKQQYERQSLDWLNNLDTSKLKPRVTSDSKKSMLQHDGIELLYTYERNRHEYDPFCIYQEIVQDFLIIKAQNVEVGTICTRGGDRYWIEEYNLNPDNLEYGYLRVVAITYTKIQAKAVKKKPPKVEPIKEETEVIYI